MASKQNPPEDPGHMKTEDETLAAKRKRSRRVSFADVEITSVHIFNRDEDHSESTTSSHPKPWNGTDSSVKAHESNRIGLFAELGVRSNDSPSAVDDKEEEREVFADGKSFFKLAETPSPGSSTAGSAFSNDAEDNFFGPVSTNFIRPPRLSDPAASDDYHDITMDSTSFSVHFRSLVRSDSGVDMKTPTRSHLVFDDKSPAPSATDTHSGSLMSLTNARKFTQESSASLDSGASDGKDSNAMSLVGEDARSYNYGTLSPSLDAIFVEGSKDLVNVSPYHLSHAESASNFECGGGEKDVKDARSSEMDKKVTIDLCGVDERSPDLSVESHINSYIKLLESVKDRESNEMDKGMPAQDQEGVKDLPCTAEKSSDLSISPHVAVSEQPVEAHKHYTESVDKMSGENISVFDIIVGTPKSTIDRSLQHRPIFQGSDDRHLKTTALGHAYTNSDVGCSSDRVFHGSPLLESVCASNVKKTQTFFTAACSPSNFSTLTPEVMVSKALLSMDSQHSLSFSSLQKSITRLKSLDRSSSPFKRGTEALKVKLRNVQLANFSHNSVLLKSGIDVISSYEDTSVDHFKLQSHDQKDIQNRHISTGNGTVSTLSRNETPGGIKTINTLSPVVLTATVGGNGECQERELPTSISHKGKLSELTAVTSPCKYLELQKEVSQLHLVVSSSPLNILANTEAGSPMKNILNEMDASETIADSVFYVSPLKSLEKRSAEFKDYRSHEGGDLKQHPEFSKFTTTVSKQNQSSLEKAVSGVCLIRNVGDMHFFSSESVQIQGSPLEKLHVDNIESSHVEASVSSLSQNNFHGANDYHKESFHSENLFYEKSHTQKRTAEVLGDRDSNNKLAKMIRLEVGTSDDYESDHGLKSSNYENERKTIGEDTALTKWDDVLNKFSEETRNMLGLVVHQLDHRAVNMMEDLLDDLQKTKDYEVVSFGMRSQKIHDQSGTLMKKRSAETLSLLFKVAYEKAHLQLNYLKRERMQKLALDLSSAIQSTQKMKQSYEESIFLSVEKDHKVGSNCHFYPANAQKDEAVGTLSGMKQEYEVLDEKTKSLVDLLSMHCNMNMEESNIHTTKSIKSYLKKRIHRRLVHEDLQSWRVANFEGSRDCHSIFLDYLGFISQRLTVTADPISLTVTNKLEERRIEEMFPKMNACCAFSYVFNAEAIEESIGSITFTDKIQITYFLLQNLVDVAVEVQAARLDIKELVKATFCSPSVGRLELLLSFVNIKSAQKLTINLDMTCLKRGIYPSEILPHHVETDNLQQQSLLTSIEASATEKGGLTVGFQRIARLCKCIAELLG